jgi:sugar lactone lactonase YvrE
MPTSTRLHAGLALLAVSLLAHPAAAQDDLKDVRWLKATAFAVPKETATEGEGYFSIIEGLNRRLYVGTHANGVNAWLVEFDPASKKMKIVVDAHQAIGRDLKGFGSQAKIHTRNNVGASGRIYFGTKQGYPGKGEKREDYPGGYPMVYDPATGQTKVYPIPVPHEGINSITPDEERGVAYISTCSDRRPGPGENAHFLILDLKTGKYRDLIDTRHIYGFIVVDHRHRAYHPVLGGDIVRYDPVADKLERLKQTIDGKPPAKESHLADPVTGHPINWDITPDGKTLYALPMSANQLYSYDLMQKGDTLAGRSLGELVPGARDTDCRAMSVGPKGTVWASVTVAHPKVGRLDHLVSYRPGDKSPRDHGPVAVSNPDFTEFTDKGGKPLPYHGGFLKLPGGMSTTRYVTMGVCEARDGNVYILALHPYSVLQVAPDQLK